MDIVSFRFRALAVNPFFGFLCLVELLKTGVALGIQLSPHHEDKAV